MINRLKLFLKTLQPPFNVNHISTSGLESGDQSSGTVVCCVAVQLCFCFVFQQSSKTLNVSHSSTSGLETGDQSSGTVVCCVTM